MVPATGVVAHSGSSEPRAYISASRSEQPLLVVVSSDDVVSLIVVSAEAGVTPRTAVPARATTATHVRI